jgi:hypothetical protein
MKKLFVTLVFLLTLVCSGFSQTTYPPLLVDGVDINSREDVRYIELLFIQKFMSWKIRCAVDYGQDLTWGMDTRVEGEDGRPITFTTNMNAMNYFSQRGWELVNAFPITAGNQYVYHYILRKRD